MKELILDCCKLSQVKAMKIQFNKECRWLVIITIKVE